MCLARECVTGFQDRAMQAWLSPKSVVANIWAKPISERRVQSQMASLVAFEAAIYLDSAVESMMVGCFLEDQETIPPATLKTNPPIDLLESRSWAQSESVHPTRSTASPERPNVSLKCAVPLR